MAKDLKCMLLVKRGFLATTSEIIDCKKFKIALGEGLDWIRIVFWKFLVEDLTFYRYSSFISSKTGEYYFLSSSKLVFYMFIGAYWDHNKVGSSGYHPFLWRWRSKVRSSLLASIGNYFTLWVLLGDNVHDSLGKGVIGSMGSGEGYGVAVEWTWEGGIARKPWEMGWYGFGGSGYGTGLLHRFKREE
ncbi:hypothetical protein Tco_0487154 [Tanacetum coccineum]